MGLNYSCVCLFVFPWKDLFFKRTGYTNEKEKIIKFLILLSKWLHALHELGQFAKLGWICHIRLC